MEGRGSGSVSSTMKPELKQKIAFITFVDPIYSLGTLYLWKLKQNHLHARVDVNVSWMMKSFYNKNFSSGIKPVFVTARGHDNVPCV
jgi:hypothetical protein